MLTKKDLEQLDNLMKRRIEQDVHLIVKAAFQDFYENLFEPHVTKSENHHEQIITEIKRMNNEIIRLSDEMGEVKEYIKDHDSRIEKLESKVLVKN